MLSSMYSGISGLKVHQIKLDVIGNNIANVNTVAFKGSTVSFQEVFSQTISSAQPPSLSGRGGQNPSQVGLGTALGGITTIHTRGNIQRTDNPNDLAIEGNGFFVVNDGINNYYTRAGNFNFDNDGNFVTVNGEKVMGWNIGTSSSVDTSKPLEAINLANLKMQASATDEIVFEGNINSQTDTYVETGGVTGEIDNFTVVTNSDAETLGKWTISLGGQMIDGDSITIGGITIPTVAAGAGVLGTDIDGGHLLDQQLDEIIAVLEANAGFDGHYSIVKSGTDLIITEKPGEATGIALTSSLTVVGGSPATHSHNENVKSIPGTDGEYSFEITSDFAPGDTINVGGVVYTAVAVGGGTETTHFEVGTGINTTATNLANAITNTASSDFDALPVAGTITLTEKVPSGANITKYDITVPEPVDNAIYYNLTVYDSLGDAHTLTAKFMKTGPNTYDYEISTTDLTIDTLTADTGTVVFTNDGKLDTSATGTVTKPIEIKFNNGASDINIAATDIKFDPEKFTQYSNTTEITSYRDGYSSGTLESFSIDSEGKIMCRFTNGMEEHKGTLALASFTNNSGLEKAGNNLFMATSNSGEPEVGTAGTGERGVIASNSLEMSNVDLSKEFTEMIVAQRGFQANSRIITTSDEVLQELVNMKR